MFNNMSNITGDCYDDMGNIVPCSSEQESFVSDTTTTQAPLVLRNQEEADYANKVIQEYADEVGGIPETFTADFETRPVGGTADAEGTTKMVPASKPWYSWVHPGTIFTNLFFDEKEKVNVPTFDQNYAFFKNIEAEQGANDYELASTLFKTLNQYPVIDGKVVTTDNLQELMADPITKKKIMKIASEYEQLPAAQANWDLQWNINMNHLKQQIYTQNYKDARQVMSDNMSWVAENLDSETKAKQENLTNEDFNDYKSYAKSDKGLKEHPFSELFDKDRNILTKSQYSINYLNAQVKQYNDYVKSLQAKSKQIVTLPNGQVGTIDASNAMGAINIFKDRPARDVRGNPIRFNYNAYNEARYKDAENLNPSSESLAFKYLGKPDNQNGNSQISNVQQYANKIGAGTPTYKTLPVVNEKNWKTVGRQLQAELNKLGKPWWAQKASIETINTIYDDRLYRIKEKYNDPKTTGVQGLAALNTYGDNPFTKMVKEQNGNRGEKVQAVPQYFSFDFRGKGENAYDDNGFLRDEVIEFGNLANFVVTDYTGKENQVVYDIGGVSEKLPSTTNASIKSFFKEMAQQIHDDAEKAQSIKPFGKITFQAVAGGKSDMYAYNIKIDNPEYLVKFKGTEDAPGPLHDIIKDKAKFEKLKTEGITVYVPRSIAEEMTVDPKEKTARPKSIFGFQTKKAREISPYESRLQRSNTLNIVIPKAGGTIITRDLKNNTITITGYTERLDPDTRQYVKTSLNPVTIDGASTLDVDDFVGRAKERMKMVYESNREVNDILLGIQRTSQ